MHEIQFNRPEKEKKSTFKETGINKIIKMRPEIDEVEYRKTG